MTYIVSGGALKFTHSMMRSGPRSQILYQPRPTLTCHWSAKSWI